ncbi:hypothetical protein MTR67_048071 [Solanum verrucosum]|uniref:Reverse transcriptase/retrotransposon-derived protein RNase H-like domain-containing protein n=1 Tax=Solanum verrucosum TaxID=315347 RepID=A0AAF0V0X5_SOLVR|nr:hypothetical protein MTR67_048071 [Solanum verrucosum]
MFEWSEACEKSFQELKDRLASALVLTLPEGTDGFVCIVMPLEWDWDVCSCKMVKLLPILQGNLNMCLVKKT